MATAKGLQILKAWDAQDAASRLSRILRARRCLRDESGHRRPFAWGWAGGTAEDDGRRVKTILDIGTGSGILALMLAQRFPEAKVDAIELEPEAAQQAQDNVSRSPYADRIEVHVRAAQGWDTRVDLVVCNPPFFHGHPKSEDRKRNLARHDDTLPLRTLLRIAKACLNERGEFAMVFPEDRANELIATAEEEGLHLTPRWPCAPPRRMTSSAVCGPGAFILPQERHTTLGRLKDPKGRGSGAPLFRRCCRLLCEVRLDRKMMSGSGLSSQERGATC